MIKKRTVFVLGAGASIPYGYPSGSELVDQILGDVGSAAGSDFYQALEFDRQVLEEFTRALRDSSTPSIDLFLEKRQRLLELGKIAIAKCLIQCEDEARLHSANNQDDWYPYVWKHLITGVDFEDFSRNQVSFVTFNYDRSLEQFLFSRLGSLYGKTSNECARQLSQIEFVHVHGYLSPLPWQGGESPRIYGSQLDGQIVLEAATNLRIVHEAKSADPLFDRAFGLLEAAEVIIFLGFSYLEDNVRRIGFPRISAPSQKSDFWN